MQEASSCVSEILEPSEPLMQTDVVLHLAYACTCKISSGVAMGGKST